MIPFFRQLRQRILTDHKFSKYLLYAIGEILLVVVGILIALQIDNWNKERQERAEEKVLLSNLLDDLDAAGKQSREFIASEENLIANLIKVLEIQAGGRRTPDSFYNDTTMNTLIWDFESNIPVINSYSEIKNTGKTSLIKNRDIREKFTNLEISLTKLSTLVKDRLTVQQLRIDNIAENHMNFVRHLNGNTTSLEVDLSREKGNDYRMIFKDPRIRNLLAMKLVLTEDVLNYRRELQAEIDLFFSLIENELNQ